MRLLSRKGFNTDLAASAGLAIDRLPQSNAEADIAEKALEEAFSNLSFNEHEKITLDVHGIETIRPSVCEATKLGELEKELSLIREKPAYERAKYLNPSFIQDRSFRLMFLRAEKFDAKHAAELIVYHFQVKQELFGDGLVLSREIRLRDLRPCDVACLRSGFIQISPSKDAAGRIVVFATPKLRTCNEILTLNRAIWYTMASALKDEDAQKNGIVFIAYNYGGCAGDNLGTIRQIRRVHAGLPFWMAGIHICYNNAFLRPAIMGMQLFLPSASRFRLRTHFGSTKYVATKLQAYGIPVDENYPVNCSNGQWSIERHHEWLKTLEANEAKESPPVEPVKPPPVEAPTIVPGEFDVLFGKGKKARFHAGTLRCVYLVEDHRERYEKAKKYVKTAIADHIIAIIYESNGRFLKWEKGGWVEVEHKVAREKVSHFFRQQRTKTNTAPPVQAATKDDTAFSFA